MLPHTAPQPPRQTHAHTEQPVQPSNAIPNTMWKQRHRCRRHQQLDTKSTTHTHVPYLTVTCHPPPAGAVACQQQPAESTVSPAMHTHLAFTTAQSGRLTTTATCALHLPDTCVWRRPACRMKHEASKLLLPCANGPGSTRGRPHPAQPPRAAVTHRRAWSGSGVWVAIK